MAFDGLFLNKIKNELLEKLHDSRIDKISQPEKDEIVIGFRNREGLKKVLLTSSSDNARVHITEDNKQNPMQAPLFTMVLRKNIGGGRLKDIVQVNGDRILNFIIESTDEMGFNSLYTLAIEIMGRHSNIILIRQRDNKIIECIKHIGMDVNSYRLLLPGADYKLPPGQDKLDIEEINESTIDKLDLDFNNEKVFMNLISGVSSKTSKVLHQKYQEYVNDGNSSKDSFNKVIGEIKNSSSYYIFYKNEEPVDISLLKPSNDFQNKYDEIKEFKSPSLALENFISSKDLTQRVKERSQDILRIISSNTDRINKKIEILNNVLVEAENKEEYMQKGELIKANIHTIKEGSSEVEVINYYDENANSIKIELNPHKSISDNMQTYFKKYNKLKRSLENATEQISLAQNELDYLNSVSDSIYRSEDPSDIEDIKNELQIAGYIKMRNSKKKKKDTPSKPMRFKSSDGVTIYVGKNNNQNDYLTTKLAEPTDTWLHTKNFPGSHVIIRALNFSDETLLEAANLAAYYSKAQTGSKVPVDYTKVKYVKKPNGSKPGMVIYTTNKTVFVDPDIPRIERF